MKMRISLQNFKKIKNISQLLISSGPFKQNMDNVLLICKDGFLTVYALDQLMHVKAIICEDDENLKIIQEGKIFVNAKTLTSLIDNLKDKTVEIFKTENNTFQISCGSFVCDLTTTNQLNFYFDDFDTKEYLKIVLKHDMLKEIYNRFKDFVKATTDVLTNNANNGITAINLKNTNKVLNVCSTDSFSVVWAHFDNENPDFELNILPSTLGKILSLIKADEEKLEFYVTDKNIIFKSLFLTLRSRLIEGKFPSIIHWFNSNVDHEIVVVKNDLIDAIDRSALLSDSFPKIIQIELLKNKMIIENKGGQRGSSKEELEIINNKKSTLKIAFNSQKLKMILKNINDSHLVLKFTTDVKPVIVKALKDEVNYQQIILPTRNF